GAELVVLDVPGAGTELSRLANELRAVPIQLDVTSRGAGRRLVSSLRGRGLTLDAVVLNAGITRDKALANMTPERWDPVLAVNISSQITLTEALIEAGDVLGEQPRVVSLASTSGIAGNRGQTNYATSKAGVIAFVDALAERLERIGGTANAVAPGFIETEMTARMPALTREIARRLNSIQQGGLPVDVAEAISFLCSAEAGGIRGETLRVCGQNMVWRGARWPGAPQGRPPPRRRSRARTSPLSPPSRRSTPPRWTPAPVRAGGAAAGSRSCRASPTGCGRCGSTPSAPATSTT